MSEQDHRKRPSQDATRTPGSEQTSGGYPQTMLGLLGQQYGGAAVHRALQRRLAQRRARQAAESPHAVQAAADQGTSGAAGSLPHLEAIQQSFGKHDVSGIQAHVDGPAKEGAEAMGAEAFATGDHVAFAGPPSLHTAAHEAAHVVQQRSGVQLKGGVGEVGDAYEQHADEVADRVVSGRSAEALLDRYADSSQDGTGSQVQRAVQRYITIGDSKNPQQVASVDDALRHIRAAAIAERDPSNIQEAFADTPGNAERLRRIRGTLTEWIASAGEGKTNALEYAKKNPLVPSGALVGASTGGFYGASYGSALGPVGTLVGGTLGAVGGGLVGGIVGGKAQDVIKATTGVEPSLSPGGPAQWRQYGSYYELGVAVAYETHPRTVENKNYEARIAVAVCNNAAINDRLNTAKRRLLAKLKEQYGNKLKALEAMLQTPYLGSYRLIGSYDATLDAIAFLEKDGDFQTNIAVIHDLMERLSSPGAGAAIPTGFGGTIPDPREDAYQTTLLKDAPEHVDLSDEPFYDADGSDAEIERRNRVREAGSKKEKDKARREMKGRTNVGTRKVSDIDTKTGMFFNAPMLAGKSMTTARLMELAEWTGAVDGLGQQIKNAIAWAIFGYWKHLYPANTVPFHTFHEVMDIAKNFGVPYKPFFYPAEGQLGGAFYDQEGEKPFNPAAR